MGEFEKLYEKYKQDVTNYLYFLTKDVQLTQELLQETFLKASIGIIAFRSKSSIKTWLFSIAKNCYLDTVRKKQPDIQYDDEILLSAGIISDSFVERIENMDILERLFESLDEKLKFTVVKRSCGYSFKEIANELKISESSARVLYHRAVKKLKNTAASEKIEP